MKTVTITPKDIESRWYVADASGKILGRFVSEIARRLRGKHKPEYTPNMDLGDHIIVINAEKIRVTGKKFKDKIYWHHSGYIGGMKEIPFDKMLEKKPTFIIEKAVKGMLPKGPLGRQIFRKLKVYAGSVHPHEAQDPELIEI